MKKLLIMITVAGAIVFSSCQKQDVFNETESDQALELKNAKNAAKGQQVLNFRAHLSGSQEVPPANTKATGQAIFQLSKDGAELSYKVIVANIQNVTMAHIHMAPFGANGPVVAWLYPSGPPPQLIPGRTNGVLAQGVIRTENLVGPLLGLSLGDLVDAIIAGNTYVNVHTSQFPGGEVRGQIWGNVPGN